MLTILIEDLLVGKLERYIACLVIYHSYYLKWEK